MIEAALAQGLFKLALVIIGAGLAVSMVLMMDRDHDLRNEIDGWSDGAKANFYGLALLGLFVLVGLALS